MGRGGLGPDDRFALGEQGIKVVELNAAEFAGWSHSFADYHEHPELARAIAPYLCFDDKVQPLRGAPPGWHPSGAPAGAPLLVPPAGESPATQPAKPAAKAGQPEEGMQPAPAQGAASRGLAPTRAGWRRYSPRLGRPERGDGS
jgi:hypothetical protein